MTCSDAHGAASAGTLADALGRLAAVDPQAYAQSRNHLDGAVTRLSPYITHGVLSLPQVLLAVQARVREATGRELPPQHKFIAELGWREYFHHVWRHRGPAIFGSLHEGPLPEAAYARDLPSDIRQGRTGLPVIDQAVRTLYASAYLHNHARLWLASYVVHVRKVHWRTGADWLYAHLLDGDLASNHLSWQWVAGTGSHKPYLFNAENVARFAPPSWHSPGTVVDTSYEALDAIARTAPQAHPRNAAAASGPLDARAACNEPVLHHEPPFELPSATPADLQGAWLVHPWNLSPPPEGRRAVGVFVAAFHRQWAWSEARWRFVHQRLQEMQLPVFWCTTPPPPQAFTVLDPHLGDWADGLEGLPVARIWPEPGRACGSFSQFWSRVQPTRR